LRGGWERCTEPGFERDGADDNAGDMVIFVEDAQGFAEGGEVRDAGIHQYFYFERVRRDDGGVLQRLAVDGCAFPRDVELACVAQDRFEQVDELWVLFLLLAGEVLDGCQGLRTGDIPMKSLSQSSPFCSINSSSFASSALIRRGARPTKPAIPSPGTRTTAHAIRT